jgi:hypothetical protein
MQKNFKKIWLISVLCVVAMAAVTVIPNIQSTNNTSAYAASPITCLLRFNDMFLNLTSASSGYLSMEGVPYHSIETLMCEAPDYGHMSTSEAFSFYVWLGAVKGKSPATGLLSPKLGISRKNTLFLPAPTNRTSALTTRQVRLHMPRNRPISKLTRLRGTPVS